MILPGMSIWSGGERHIKQQPDHPSHQDLADSENSTRFEAGQISYVSNKLYRDPVVQPTLIPHMDCRIIEDYAVLFFGSSIFKIGRLLFVALLSVHLFACAFFRVKRDTSSQEEVDNFYLSRNVDSMVMRAISISLPGTSSKFMILLFVCRISQMRM